MKRSSITASIEQIQLLLESAGQYLLPQGELEDFSQRTGALLEKALSPGEILYVGILGGTGVGKSTLVNALAKEKISDPSDRRPYTDKAVVYRFHETGRGLEKVSHLLKEPDALHTVESIRDLILLDLPDFDSVEENNRRTVLQLLPELDSIIWVVSPEKYADAVFYDMVSRTRIHRDSFVFVLNKADQLIADGQPDRYGRLKDVQGDLIFRLRHEAGVQEPRVFCLSAEKEFNGTIYDSVLADEFLGFHKHLMVRRDAKEIASVKTINLMEETRRLIEDLDASIHPEEKSRVLKSIDQIEFNQSDNEERTIESYEHEKALGESLLRHLTAEDASIASVRWAMRLLSPGRLTGAVSSIHDLEAVFQTAAGERKKAVRTLLEKTSAQVDSELVLSFRRGDDTRRSSRTDELLENAVKNASKAFAQHVNSYVQSLRGPLASCRRLWQKLVLMMPVPFLLLRLCGLERIESSLDAPSVTGVLKVALGLLTTLFSSEGLTGLLVMALCQIILVYFLAARRIRKLEKNSRNLAESAIAGLNSRLDSVAAKIEAQRKQTIACMNDGINRLIALNSEFSPAEPQQARERISS